MYQNCNANKKPKTAKSGKILIFTTFLFRSHRNEFFMSRGYKTRYENTISKHATSSEAY